MCWRAAVRNDGRKKFQFLFDEKLIEIEDWYIQDTKCLKEIEDES